MARKFLGSIFPVVAFSVTVVAATGLSGSADSPLDVGVAATAETVVTSTFRVEGMTCSGCATAVRYAVEELEGVQEAKVSYKEKRATVTHDPARIQPDEIIAVIEKLGYEAELEEEGEKPEGQDGRKGRRSRTAACC